MQHFWNLQNIDALQDWAAICFLCFIASHRSLIFIRYWCLKVFRMASATYNFALANTRRKRKRKWNVWCNKNLCRNGNMDKIKSKFSSSDFALRELSKFEWLRMTAEAAATTSVAFAASGSVLTTTNNELLKEIFVLTFSVKSCTWTHNWA